MRQALRLAVRRRHRLPQHTPRLQRHPRQASCAEPPPDSISSEAPLFGEVQDGMGPRARENRTTLVCHVLRKGTGAPQPAALHRSIERCY